MSIWMQVKVVAGHVFFESGDEFVVGSSRKMGMGTIELRETRKAGLHVVRLSAQGRFTYALLLRKDGEYRLGASRGHRVIPPAEEKDPIKRVLREFGVPVSKLRIADKSTLEVDDRWYDNSACPVGRKTHRWLTDGEMTQTAYIVLERPEGFFHGGGRTEYTISDATCAVCAGGGRITDVVVWPGCEPGALADVIAEARYGEGADRDYPAALPDLEAARKWVDDKIGIVAGDNPEYIEVGGYGVWIGDKVPYSTIAAVDGLLDRHGIDLLWPFMTDAQRSYHTSP